MPPLHYKSMKINNLYKISEKDSTEAMKMCLWIEIYNGGNILISNIDKFRCEYIARKEY